MVGVAADVTESKQLEAELMQAQKMELVGKLAGGIAHDFNNLLTIISGYVSILLDRDSLPPAASESLKRVFTASRQATGLVRQLLMFSRKRAPRREVIDINVEVEQMAVMIRRLLGETIIVEFEPSAEAPRANADVAMLEQAVVNLAVNARDSMPRGGRMTLSVGVRRHVSSAATPAPSGDYVSIAVRDTGAGISPAILPRIFEPFFTTKDEGRGTGLGLPTAKDIAKRHEGWIDVESTVGKGSVFTLYLPQTRAAPAAPLAPEAHQTGKGTILLVEDETNVREYAAAVLQQEGYTLYQAKSGDNALEMWKWHAARIELILTDVVLPGEVSGPQLCARLLKEKPGLKVILTTGYGRETIESRPIENPPPYVLSKPYTPRALLQAVREVLR
jgi:nitrogen-specific signal transduction histidine kinase